MAAAPGAGATTAADDRWVASEDQLPWTSSKIATYNAAQKLFRCADCECVGFLARVAEHWLGTHANLRVFQCPQCPYASAWARCVRMHLTRQHNVPEDGASTSLLLKENPVLEEVTKYLQRLKTKVETSPPGSIKALEYSSAAAAHLPSPAAPRPPSASEAGGGTHHHAAAAGGNKRYCCNYCPYSTDRRDLFTRHENIHREEKPFQCYVCQKQFNRADHVKKHFTRMHRDYPYDLNRIRRQPPKNASGMSYYHKYNNNHIQGSPTPNGVARDANAAPNNQQQQQQLTHLTSQPQHQMVQSPMVQQPPQPQHHSAHHNLNIPGGFPMRGANGGANNGGRGANADMKQQQQQQQQHDAGNGHLNVNGCNAKSHISKNKKKAEKRYSCCYCAWSGVDNWCLKRHLNTHLKPFVCVLCDYKAARSERLATHVLKVHNKRACGRCNFLADDQTQLSQHLQEHQHQGSGNSFSYGSSSGYASSGDVVKRGGGYRGGSGGYRGGYRGGRGRGRGGQQLASGGAVAVLGAGAVAGYEHATQQQQPPPQQPPPPPRVPRTFGAARLFNYLEASDASDEGEGDEDEGEGEGEDEEEDSMGAPPMPIEEEPDDPTPFVCHSCGCEFADDYSLETHRMTHHRLSGGGSSYSGSSYGVHSDAGVRATRLRRVIRRRVALSERRGRAAATAAAAAAAAASGRPFTCALCGQETPSQTAIIAHMREHSGPALLCRADACDFATPLGEAALRAHVGLAHPDDEGRCTDCGLTAQPDALRRHVEVQHPPPTSSSKRRKQSQPRRLPPEDDDDDAVPTVRPARRATTRGPEPTPEVLRLRDKHAGALLARGRRRCPWCRHMHAVTFPYHTPASLGLHDLWRHSRASFQCEHCDLRFRHRYQVVLHASREHVRANAPPVTPAAIVVPVVPANVCEPILSVPEPLKLLPPPVLCDLQPPSVPPPSFAHLQVPDSSLMHKDMLLLRERPCAMEDSPTLNTPHPAPPPSVAPPPLPPASPPVAS